jgi:hypothetical protein
MATTVYAVFSDVTAEYEGDIPAADQARIERLLTKASARLTAIVPGLPSMLTQNQIDPNVPMGLVIDAVLQVYRNPTGATLNQVGPFTQSFLRGEKQSSDISFDEVEVRRLILGEFNRTPSTFKVHVPPRDPRLGPQVPYGGLDADGRYTYTPEQFRGL